MRLAILLTGLGLALAACGGAAERDLGSPQPARSALGSLVINEHSAGASGWVELFNSGAAAVDVSGWSIDDVTGGGAAPKVLPAGSAVPAGGFLVATYAGLNAASADTVNLLDAAGTLVDSHGNGYAGASVAGLCFGRQPDGGAWAAAALPCSRGASNGASAPPAAVAVVVNEFQAGSAGWIELYNAGEAAADLSGYSVDDVAGGGSSPKAVGAGVVVQPKAFLVVAFGGINTASADTVSLLDPTGAVVDSHSNFYTTSISGLCFGRKPDGGDWAPSALACTKGASNGAAIPPPAPEVFINEFQAGTAGWIELYNAGATTADLSYWTVDDVAGGGASPKLIGVQILVGPKATAVVPFGGVNTSSADEVRLLDASGAVVDSHSNFYAGSSISGRCFGRQPDGGAWAGAALPCTQGYTNGTATPPPAAQILINEFTPGSNGWVELFNAGTAAVDLGGWTLDDVAAGGASPKVIVAGTSIAPGAVAVVGFSGVNTGSADQIRLLDATGAEVDAHSNFYGADPCYGTGRCYGRVPDGGAWAVSHLPCTRATVNPYAAPDPCHPGSSCDDGNACTAGDTCSSSCVCTPGPAPDCDDQDACTSDSCWPTYGCTHTAAPDGTTCNGTQQCVGGVCGGTVPTGCVATGGTYKTIAFTKDEECKAVDILNKARYSQLAMTTTAKDIAYDCSPNAGCGYRSSAWKTVAEYSTAFGYSSSQTVGATSLVALRNLTATWVDDGGWYDTVARAWTDRTVFNGRSFHFESVYVDSATNLCMVLRDEAGAPNYLSACIDPWYCGPEGCPADILTRRVGTKISLRGTLSNETGAWKVTVKTYREANPKLP